VDRVFASPASERQKQSERNLKGKKTKRVTRVGRTKDGTKCEGKPQQREGRKKCLSTRKELTTNWGGILMEGGRRGLKAVH